MRSRDMTHMGTPAFDDHFDDRLVVFKHVSRMLQCRVPPVNGMKSLSAIMSVSRVTSCDGEHIDNIFSLNKYR